MSTTRPIDYSRFDRIVEQEEEEEESRRGVNVTRYEKPTAVTIRGKNDSVPGRTKGTCTPTATIPAPTKKASDKYDIKSSYERFNRIDYDDDDEEETDEVKQYYEDDWRRMEMEKDRLKSASSNVLSASSSLPPPRKEYQKSIENGADNGFFRWRQTKDDATLAFPVGDGVKAKDVCVRLAKREGNENAEAGETKRLVAAHTNLVIEVATWASMRHRVLPLANPVWGDFGPPMKLSAEEERFNREMEWELKDVEGSGDGSRKERCVVVHLHKRLPPGVKGYWWRKVFENCEEEVNAVDVQGIQARSKTSSAGEEGSLETNQRVWRQAHEAFLKQRLEEETTKRIQVDVDGEEVEEEEQHSTV